MLDATCEATTAPLDLSLFCRLDGLGLVITGQQVAATGAVLVCLVAEADRWRRRCGCEGGVSSNESSARSGRMASDARDTFNHTTSMQGHWPRLLASCSSNELREAASGYALTSRYWPQHYCWTGQHCGSGGAVFPEWHSRVWSTQ
jgi:hypothetical protein